MKTLLLCALVVIFIVPWPASAEIYQWKDSQGRTIFSDTPPPGTDATIKKVRKEGFERPYRSPSSSPQPKNAEAGLRPISDIRVILYMTDWCPYCAKAREYIRSLGASLTEYDIERDKDKRDEMLRKSGGRKGVPLIDVEGIILRGYNPDGIKSAIESRRRTQP